MSLVIEKVRDKNLWEDFLKEVPNTPFLQSFTWGEFQKEIGNKVYRFGIFENEKLAGVASSYQIKARLTSYLYVPWGPVLKSWEKDRVENLVAELFKTSKQENLDFIRFEPRTIGESENQILTNLGFKKTPIFTQPDCTALIDLSRSEDEILSTMSSSTRYNVRMVERRGIKVRQGTLADLSIFETLLKETAGRHRFTIDIHPDYYKKQFKILNKDLRSLRSGDLKDLRSLRSGDLKDLRSLRSGDLKDLRSLRSGDLKDLRSLRPDGLKDNMMEIFVAEFDKKPLAAALVTFYGDTTTYLHAASTREQAKLRVPYLLAWKSILEGKKRGYQYFDFWGVAPEDASENHAWAGVTSFKMSFGGRRECYSPVFDLPISNRYMLAKFIELSRKPLRKILRLS